MSGIVQNNILRSSGTVAVSAAGLNWNSTIITGSTATVEAGNGYWINTTSNTCTITLPSSAEAGDQIVLIDFLRTWGTNKIIIDSNGLNYQGNADTYTVEYTTSGQSLNIVYSDATKGWLPLDDDVAALEPVAPSIQKGLFGYGNGSYVSMTNKVSSSGVVATDTSGVGTGREGLAAASYGGDKAIFAYGFTGGSSVVSMSNLVNNSGTVASDVSGVGTARQGLAGASYGVGLAIFGYGHNYSSNVSMTNKVNILGVIASDVDGVGTARMFLAAAGYGGDKAIFGYGTTGSSVSLSNLVNNSGVVAADVTGVGTGRAYLAACSFGGDKAVFGYGDSKSMTNKVSNLGVVATDTTGVGLVRAQCAATVYGGDKGIFGYGGNDNTGGYKISLTNLVNNQGNVAADVTGVGTARYNLAAAGYSYSA